MSLSVDVRLARAGFSLEVALTAEAGQVTAVFGPSGAGKTSLIHAVAGLVPQAEGRIVLNGRTLLDDAAGVRLPAHGRRIGIVFQEGRLFPHLTVAGNLRYGARRARGRPANGLSTGELMAALGIETLLDRRPATLSGGERQRVALGRALLSEPELLLLDEPLASLDAARRAEILPCFERLRDLKRIPILYVSHSTEEIARLADQAVALDAGRVVARGTVAETFAALDFRAGGEGFEPESVITATVAGHDRADGLTDLAVGEIPIAAPTVDAPVGMQVRLRIKARDVMIALSRPEGVSANNILPGTVVRSALTGSLATLLLECQGQPLAAQITRRAFDRLGLAEGRAVYAVVKTVTIAR